MIALSFCNYSVGEITGADDEGYWIRLENYIETHSVAQFSHGICEKCLDRFYPEANDDEMVVLSEICRK